MIDNKYECKNYNGLRNETLRVWSDNYEINPFSGKVVIIDEAHNFISFCFNFAQKLNQITWLLMINLMEILKI